MTERRLLPAERRLGRGRASPCSLFRTPRGTHVQEPAEAQAARARALVAADSIIRHEAGGAARRRSRAWQLAGRVPVGSYPVDVDATPAPPDARVAGREGARRRAEPERPQPAVAERLRRPHQQLPVPAIDRARARAASSASRPNSRLRRMTPRAARQLRPSNAEAAAGGHADPRPAARSSTSSTSCARTARYDQILGDDSRGDGDPKLTLFGESITPNAHALARRFPLLDHVYANSEASIDGHFWTAAGRRVRLRRQELAPELRRPRAPVRLRRLRGHLAVAGLPVRPGREAGHLVLQLRRGGGGRRAAVPGQGPDAGRPREGEQEVRQVGPRRRRCPATATRTTPTRAA